MPTHVYFMVAAVEFRFMQSLPMTATGKVRKVEIIEKYISS